MPTTPSFIFTIAISMVACSSAPVPVNTASPPISSPEESGLPKTESVAEPASPEQKADIENSPQPDEKLAVVAEEVEVVAEPETAPAPTPFIASKDDFAQCAPAIQVLVDLTESIDSSIHKHMRKKRRQLIKKCKKRLTSGDKEFHRDLLCVANSESTSELVNCNGWTDWPAM